ncbi:DUF892 family protein [Candidatus Woesearchaeota archaeon]|nr:DUF892 family protein [Candidatus Woesearchaeota archaeon]
MITYKKIILAAEKLGDTETSDLCRQILKEEQKAAENIEITYPALVEDTVLSEVEMPAV